MVKAYIIESYNTGSIIGVFTNEEVVDNVLSLDDDYFCIEGELNPKIEEKIYKTVYKITLEFNTGKIIEKIEQKTILTNLDQLYDTHYREDLTALPKFIYKHSYVSMEAAEKDNKELYNKYLDFMERFSKEKRIINE